MALKILVVDDDRAILDLIKAMVEPWGYQISPVQDSREALRLLESEKFDGLFFDILMPDLDGFELARRARASSENNETPIVMITGMQDIETMRRCFGVGVTLFLNKPFNYERLYNLFHAAKGPLLREQQKTARLPFCTLVDCLFGTAEKHHFRAQSVNIGETGMLLEPSGGLEVGQEVELEFTLPLPPDPAEKVSPRVRRAFFAEEAPTAGGPHRLHARTVRKAPPDRIAVQFLSLTPRDRQSLQRFIFGRVMT